MVAHSIGHRIAPTVLPSFLSDAGEIPKCLKIILITKSVCLSHINGQLNLTISNSSSTCSWWRSMKFWFPLGINPIKSSGCGTYSFLLSDSLSLILNTRDDFDSETTIEKQCEMIASEIRLRKMETISISIHLHNTRQWLKQIAVVGQPKTLTAYFGRKKNESNKQKLPQRKNEIIVSKFIDTRNSSTKRDENERARVHVKREDEKTYWPKIQFYVFIKLVAAAQCMCAGIQLNSSFFFLFSQE